MTIVSDQDAGSSEQDPIGVVEDYLLRQGRGDLAGAARHLSPDVTIVFPGDRRHTRLAEVVAAGAGRYRSIDKDRDEYHSFVDEHGDTLVVSIGRLHGVNTAGVGFANIRYVDVFRLRGGLIVEQRVWNDLAESGVLNARSVTALPPAWRSTKIDGER
ncbi:nuclear transport factor 2 family protein [uncultured Aeromicrobium sp.]|uniref:nuclear transport factor 2 family protein n=1 Tax=uncultured Aeromicrobium sp. TaxID=337820 RepID=UPI0025ECE058|nr:nuclear transport factor 2 family protein [uncultured Aeromicrobium sp.]